MKIIYFLDFPYCIGGSNKVLLTQAYIMKLRGHEVTMVIPDDEEGSHASEYDVICQRYGLHAMTATYPIATCMESVDILSSIEHYDGIYALIKKENVQLICSTQINVAVEMVARELGIPHLMNIYQTDEESFKIPWLDVYPHYHSVDSELFSAVWREGLHIASRCIRVAYRNEDGRQLAVKDKAVKDNGLPLQILSVGVLCERKNQLEIIKFILKCKESGIRAVLTFLGDDTLEYGKLCKKFVSENELEDEVIFKGFVLDVEEYYDKSDLMILASTVESYPGVIVESIARGVAVLSTPVAGVPELMEDGRNSFLAKGYCSEDIYEAFNRYLTYKKENKIRDIINCAYKTYMDNHSYEAVGSELDNYYGWIIRNYKSGGRYLKIDKTKNIFSVFLNHKEIGQMHPYTRRNVWFLYHIYEKIKGNMPKKVVIWGAGFFGGIALEWIELLKCGKQFAGFIDSYKKDEYLSYPILQDKEQAIKDSDMIWVAVGDMGSRLEIIEYLGKLGKKRNEDYFMFLNEPIRVG